MTRTLVLVLALAAGGCSALDTRTLGREKLTNAQGHVIGHKETLRDLASGELLTKIALYVPRIEDGRVVGYEERVRGGAVLRDLEGRTIGNRFVDLRSRGSNPRNRGLTILVYSEPAPALAAPSIAELKILARLGD